MIIDTSAMAAILLDEPERALFLKLIGDSAARKMSAASVVELVEIYHRKFRSPDPVETMLRDLAELDITVVAVTAQQAVAAADARVRFGKGAGHPAQLNYGDSFAYALSQVMALPLLFKGDDFSRTDVTPVT